MIKKIFLGLLILLVGYGAGLISHLHYYPREAFLTYYEKIAKEGGEGRWVHRRQLCDETVTDFPRPNNDTLYSSCMVDLSKGPVVIETPAIDRYWSVQFMRDNTDTFHYLASRIQGLNKPARALLVLKVQFGGPLASRQRRGRLHYHLCLPQAAERGRQLAAVAGNKRTDWIDDTHVCTAPGSTGGARKISDARDHPGQRQFGFIAGSTFFFPPRVAAVREL